MTYTPDVQPIIIIGPNRYPSADDTTAQNLTTDGMQGAFSVTVASGTGFAAGQFVLLDELSGASWQPVPAGFGCYYSGIGASFTGSLSGSTLTVTAVSAPTALINGVIYPGDTLSAGLANTTIVSQQSGTTGGVGSYTVTPGGQNVASTTITSAGPCPPLVWKGDHLAYAMHWPQQTFLDDNRWANVTGPFQVTPGDSPYPFSWFSRLDRHTNEIKEVASVSGNTVTFTSPLTIGYRVNHTAQLTRYTTGSIQVTNAGVESLTTSGGADGQVHFDAAAYSWAKDIEVAQWYGEGVAINNSFRIEVRDSYFHTGSWPVPGGAGYALSLANGSSEVLIENNIFLDTCKDMVMRSSGSGSVVGYNYADDSWDYGSNTWVEVGLNASHMAGPHHVLFEGNYSHNFDSDYTHGNAIYLTIFRNVLSGQRRSFTDVGNIRTVGLTYGSWWDSFVGNILGRSGQMSGWVYTDPSMTCDANGNNCTGNAADWSTSDIWKLGIDSAGHYTMHPDPQVLATVIRDGNYDFLTNSQRWHNTPATFPMPNSMYLTSKPAFFGNNPWPWSDPATGAIYTLPAKARYDAGAP
jgi:hypothetical protein